MSENQAFVEYKKATALQGGKGVKEESLGQASSNPRVVSIRNKENLGYAGENKEFVQFLFITKSSAAEVQTQLYLAMDQKYIQFDNLYEKLEVISKQISKFITSNC